jgi:hypothetical protein
VITRMRGYGAVSQPIKPQRMLDEARSIPQDGRLSRDHQSEFGHAARAALAGLTPLEFMLQIMRNPDQDLAFRAEMAKAAAPYVHQKLVATDNMNRRMVTPRTDKSIAELRDELLQDMVEAGLVTLLPAPEPAPAGVANRKDGTSSSASADPRSRPPALPG